MTREQMIDEAVRRTLREKHADEFYRWARFFAAETFVPIGFVQRVHQHWHNLRKMHCVLGRIERMGP